MATGYLSRNVWLTYKEGDLQLLGSLTWKLYSVAHEMTKEESKERTPHFLFSRNTATLWGKDNESRKNK